MNNLHASSDDPAPERDWANPFGHQNIPVDPTEKVRRKLLAELKKLSAEFKIELSYDAAFTNVSVTPLDESVTSDYPILGKPLLMTFNNADHALGTFISSTAKHLPKEPVGVGAVWITQGTESYVSGLTSDIVTRLTAIALRGTEQIATLKTETRVSVRGPREIMTPTGDRVKVKNALIEDHGTTIYNITRQVVESEENRITGRYTAIQGGQSAKCNFNMTVKTSRVHDSDGVSAISSP